MTSEHGGAADGREDRDGDGARGARTGGRPGDALGIPEGLTGEEVVDAVLGAGGIGGTDGIDPELLPYLDAADGETGDAGDAGRAGAAVDDLRSAGAAVVERRARAEEADLEALRELVAASMIPGGDLERLDALLAEVDEDEDDWQDWEPRLPD